MIYVNVAAMLESCSLGFKKKIKGNMMVVVNMKNIASNIVTAPSIPNDIFFPPTAFKPGDRL